MPEKALRALHQAVNALNKTDSLSILNIDEALFDSPETTLEYRARCKAWTQLKNTASSIPDLLQQPDSIALVGFLGHFSSGKSSLINALLDVAGENPEHEREVGQHPTDTRITLITHRDHANLVKGSAYTALDTIDVVRGPALDFLQHATLVDTPGLGNDEVEHEAVSRFLHLCHVLVITIAARVPFADKDKDFELLDTAFNGLEGVPKILVITSSEEFLSSRQGRFETDWQQDLAETFWQEALERLKNDPRFRNHLSQFHDAGPFFVDSKEPFGVDEVKEALLPIVTDGRQRSRIRRAQGRYVLATAAEALDVLLAYIGERSRNLKRLREEAQRRAKETEDAVEELLQSLESSFETTRQRLREGRQTTPTVAFGIERAVTPQAIKEADREAVRGLERQLVATLSQRMTENRKSTWRLVLRFFRGRTRRGGWLRTRKPEELDLSSDLPFSLSRDIPELAPVSEACARSMRDLVNQQVVSTVASCTQHLRGRSEAQTIGSATYEIESLLHHFERKLDHSIRGLYAYVTAPDSLDLLREHGFVEFDRSGKQLPQTESIDALRLPGFASIEEASETSKERLRSLAPEHDEGLRRVLEEMDAWAESTEDGRLRLGEDHGETVARRVEAVCQRGFSEFVSGVSQHIDRLVERTDEAANVVTEARQRVREARLKFLTRGVWIVGVGLAVLGAFYTFAPSGFERLLEGLRDNLQAILLSTVPTIVIPALGYFLIGARNEDLRQALKIVWIKKWTSYRERKGLEKSLAEYFDESYTRLVTSLGETPLEVDEAIVEGIVGRLRSQDESYGRMEKALKDARRAIGARSRLFDEYINVVRQRLDGIPQELRDRASAIKESAIEEHLSRIEVATEAVEGVEADVRRIADIAAGPH